MHCCFSSRQIFLCTWEKGVLINFAILNFLLTSVLLSYLFKRRGADCPGCISKHQTSHFLSEEPIFFPHWWEGRVIQPILDLLNLIVWYCSQGPYQTSTHSESNSYHYHCTVTIHCHLILSCMKSSEFVSVNLFKEARMSLLLVETQLVSALLKKWYIWVAKQFLEQGTSCGHSEVVVQKEETKMCEFGVLESSIRTQDLI